MKSTIVLVSHNRPIQEETRRSVLGCVHAGALFCAHGGVTDVTLARNLALSEVVRAIHLGTNQAGAAHVPDVVLMVDDDMTFTVADAQALVDSARANNVAASAMYATALGTLAATRLETQSGAQRWATGLGLLAVPVPLLLVLAEQSEKFVFMEKTNWGFTWSAASGGNYWSEDFTLCRRLGGVHLLPIGVGHLKTIPLYPDEETIACVRDGRAFSGELDPKILAHVQDGEMAMRFHGAQPDALGKAALNGNT